MSRRVQRIESRWRKKGDDRGVFATLIEFFRTNCCCSPPYFFVRFFCSGFANAIVTLNCLCLEENKSFGQHARMKGPR